jgi:hypothetical protein
MLKTLNADKITSRDSDLTAHPRNFNQTIGAGPYKK